MFKSKRWIGFLLIVVLVASLTPTSGAWTGETPARPSLPDSRAGQAPSNSTATAPTQNPPVPLPEDCDDVTPPGEDPPACCAYGYVYYDGVPVEGASVHIESLYGALDTATASGGASSDPYYQVDLSAAPLLVSPGDIITVTATYYGSSANIVYEVAPGGQQVDVVIPVNPLFGDGRDGDLIVGSGETVYTDNVRQPLSATANAGQDTLTLPNTVGFAIGDKVLIHQTQGSNAGLYELGTIKSTGSGSVILYENLANTYTVGGNSKAQVIRVPQYRNVVIDPGATVLPTAWDGNVGGILTFLANVEVTINGTVTADEKGYRGGRGQNNTGGLGSRGEQGENETGSRAYSGAAAGMGGGGGETQGSDDCAPHIKSGGGGGGGGHAAYGQNGNTGNCSGGAGGTSGGIFGNDLASQMVFGGGGGGAGGWRRCDIEKADRVNGANGGGIIMIRAGGISIPSGYVRSQGGDGGAAAGDDDQERIGGSGAGAGGSIYLIGISVDAGTGRVDVSGGIGHEEDSACHGGRGGDGGVGRFQIQYIDDTLFKKPIATIHTIYPRPAIQDQDTITFRGSAVDNDENGDSITQYVWRSDLDGVLSTQASFAMTASDLSAGTHTIYFKARDDEGEWSDEVSTSLMVTPAQGASPTAAFTVSPSSGYTTTIFSFDASGCSDNEDPVTALEVRWDWQDDGTYDTGWSTTKNITHTFAATGTYTVRLQVRDTDDQTDSTTHTVTVNPPPSEAAWAFLLYLDGDNNLYSWLQRALDNLEAVAANPDLTVLALLDGYGNGNTWRYHVQPGGEYTDGVNRWYMEELDMSDPQTLSDFVTWARDNYPADHYYLAVADHGRGTTGIAWDDTSGSGQFITVAELRTALRDATTDGTEPLDIVHYDACLMAMLENAYQVKDYAGYLIASENLGWSIFAYDRYAAVVTATTTPAQLAGVVVDEYHNSLAGYPRTISALDLGQAGAVEDAVTAMAAALRADLETYKYHVLNSRDAAQKFDSRDYLVINLDDEYLDLYDLARLLKQNVPDTAVQNAAQGVMDAVTAFVVAEQHESGYYQDYPYWDLDDAHGVSIYFPPTSGGWDYSDYMSHVFRFTAEGEWDEFLQDYFGLMGLPPETPTDPGLPPVLEMPYAVYLPMVVK